MSMTGSTTSAFLHRRMYPNVTGSAMPALGAPAANPSLNPNEYPDLNPHRASSRVPRGPDLVDGVGALWGCPFPFFSFCFLQFGNISFLLNFYGPLFCQFLGASMSDVIKGRIAWFPNCFLLLSVGNHLKPTCKPDFL